MLSSSDSYRFGDFVLSPARRELRSHEGVIAIERKVMDLLVFLIENRDRVVTKDEIQDAIWPGTIVTETALTRAIMKARRAVGDSAEDQRVIATVHGQGYRFVAAIELTSIPDPVSPPTRQQPETQTLVYMMLALAVLFLIAIAVVLIPPLDDGGVGRIAGTSDGPGAASFSRTPVKEAAEPAAPVLAVLPFDNLSPDPEHAYFASGIQEEILNELARGTNLRVIARTSVAQYAGTTKTIPDIATELGASSIVEGSVRYTDGRVRITAQLIDGRSGVHLWSNSYDRDFADIFRIQSDIAREVAMALEARVLGPTHRSDTPASALAYKEYLLARSLRYRTFEVGWEPVLEHARKSLEHDPAFLPSLALMHNAYQNRIIGDSHEDANAQMQAITQRAIQRDPHHAITVALRAKDAAYQWRWAESARYWEEALQKDPGDPDNLGTAAMFLLASGDYERAEQIVRMAVETNPLHDWGHYADMLLRLARQDIEGARSVGELIISMGGNRAFPASATLAMYAAADGDAAAVRRYGETLLAMTGGNLAPFVDAMAAHADGETLSSERVTRLLQSSPPPNTYKWMGVQTYLLAEDHDSAFEVLDDIARSRAVFSVLRVVSDPAFEALWADPRFLQFRERTGLRERLSGR